MVTGCGEKESASSKQVFTQKDGLLTYTDTQNSPFNDCGLKITIKKGEKGYVKFVKTDLEGTETVEYYNFDYDKNIVEKYYYVSAMATGFYYYYDLEKGELIRIEDNEHNDSTEKVKASKRWDNAYKSVDDEIKILEKYYKQQYNMTIKEAVLDK